VIDFFLLVHAVHAAAFTNFEGFISMAMPMQSFSMLSPTFMHAGRPGDDGEPSFRARTAERRPSQSVRALRVMMA
jgi:hypothetical protein